MSPVFFTWATHLGTSIQDLLIRYKRMRGFRTLWIPGTDHAAIATQARVEKDIQKKESKSRYDLGREELLKRSRYICSRQSRYNCFSN
jgi:valyl-tRNA synthetase